MDLTALRFDDRGLLPVVVQDAATGAVLMVAFADREAVERTVATGEAWFWSRSRGRLWRKGETSGNVLDVVSVTADCDSDALLVRARPRGPTCHRGTASCFEPAVPGLELGWLARVVAERRTADVAASYTARLFAEGLPRIAQKVGEEGVETVIAGLDASEKGRERLVTESADLLFHLLVLLEARGVAPEEVARELERRHTDRSAAPHGKETR